MSEKKLPRDEFVEVIYQEAKKNRDIYFLNADLGAQALDTFRESLKEQFIHVGISEQNMMDMAAGLALEGKTVYVYAMAPFVTLRCYEQIKVALASMNLPVTIIGIGAGYSYAPAGPTHYATEDISCMRCLGNMEVFSPSDTATARYVAKLTYQDPRLRYVRLDRSYLAPLYSENDPRMRDGIAEIATGDEICLITNGYMIAKAQEIRALLEKEGIHIGIIDLFKIHPLDPKALRNCLKPYQKIITLEEHFLTGGLGSAVAEAVIDHALTKSIKRIGIKDKYLLENGSRDYLHVLAGIDNESVISQIKSFII